MNKIIVGVLLLVISTFTVVSNTLATNTIGVGSTAIVSNGLEEIWVGTTRENFNELFKYLFAKDAIGVYELFYNKQVISLKPGTRVKIIDITWDGLYQIRVLEGRYVGSLGWLPWEWVKE